MDILKFGENKLKAVTDWIANEGRDDRWFLDIRTQKEAKSIQLQENKIKQFTQLAIEFEKLTSLSEKLEFYKANCVFEFPFTRFCLRREKSTYYIFDFNANPQISEEIHLYNIWFVNSSKDHLLNHNLAINGLPFTNYKFLKNKYDFLKSKTPLIERFIHMEMENIKSMCDKSLPKKFDQLYSYRVNAKQINLTNKALDRSFWPDLFVWPYVEYYIQLEKCLVEKTYELPALDAQVATTRNQTSPTSVENNKKAKPSKIKKITFTELFKNDQSKAEKFIQILVTCEYLTPNKKWNFEIFKPGLIVAIIEFLEIKGIIKNLNNRTRVGEIFNEKFDFIMSTRNYRKSKVKLVLDVNLEEKLEELLS